MAKAIWKGSLSFGLISIPIQIYSAIKEHIIGLHLLCKTCHHPISYRDWCSHEQKYVNWENIEKGFKLPNGSFFVITQKKLKELKPEKSEVITLEEFIPAHAIPWIYIEKHFYVGPGKAKNIAYALFQEALVTTQTVALGRFVMRDKEYICVIAPHETGLVLHTLNYVYEIRPFPVKKTDLSVSISPKQLQLAKQLIEQSTTDRFDISSYRDTFIQELAKTIKRGKKGAIPQESTAKAKKEAPVDTQLLTMLKKSLVKNPRQPSAPSGKAARTIHASKRKRSS